MLGHVVSYHIIARYGHRIALHHCIITIILYYIIILFLLQLETIVRHHFVLIT